MNKVVLFAPGAFACSLGIWQVQRHGWKKQEIVKRENKLCADPQDVKALLQKEGGNGADLTHTPVSCRGEFKHEDSIYVGPRPRSEFGQTFSGYMLVTPMKVQGNDRKSSGGNDEVLVLRGWVPDVWKNDPSRFKPMQPKGNVTLHGILRGSDSPGRFAPSNIPEKGQFFFFNVPQMVSTSGTKSLSDSLFVEEMDINEKAETSRVKLSTAMDVLAFRTERKPDPKLSSRLNEKDEELDTQTRRLLAKLNTSTFPIQRTLGDFMRFSVTPQDHVNYAATWFTLAAATTVMAFARLRSAGGSRWWSLPPRTRK